MHSVIFRRFGGPEVLEIVDTPIPEPGQGQVRVRVVASAVSPIDLSARAGRLTEAGLLAPAAEIGLGWDVAGTVSAVGPAAQRFEVGAQVVGLRDLLFACGAHADYVVLDETALAPAPTSVPLTDAATLPLNALTADRALDLADLRPGQTLLVTGAAGGVGGFVLELAALRGLRTIALTRRHSEQHVRTLGASEVLTSSEDLGNVVRKIVPGGVDAVMDAATLGIVAHQALRSTGTFVALVAPFAPPKIRATRVVVQEVFADGARLADLASLVDAHKLSLHVERHYALREVRAAHEHLERGGLHGRLVLTP